MSFRDLTIRVLGDFSNREYASLAYEVGLRLEAAGLGKRAFLVTDGKINGIEMYSAQDGPGDGTRSRRHRA
jgi:hypothetical protein